MDKTQIGENAGIVWRTFSFGTQRERFFLCTFFVRRLGEPSQSPAAWPSPNREQIDFVDRYYRARKK